MYNRKIKKKYRTKQKKTENKNKITVIRKYELKFK